MHLSTGLALNGAHELRVSGFLCIVLATVLWAGPAVLRADLFNGDAAHHVFWLYRYADPTLFPNDLSIEYFASPSVAPWGYRALYAMIVLLGDTLLVAKIVAAVLLVISLGLAWRLGAALVETGRPLAGLLAVLATAALLPLNDLLPPMGLQRSFALPITLLCLWALVSRRYAWVGISWLAAALFYPIIVPVLGLGAGLVFLDDLLRDRQMPPHFLWNALLGGLAISIIVLGSGVPEAVGPMVTKGQVLTMPEFGPNGRQDLFGSGSIGSYFWHHRTGLGWSRKMLLVMGIAVGLTAVLHRHRLIPRAAWLLAIAGVALWLVARLALLHLYLPNRHSRLVIAAFAIVAFTAAAFATIEAAAIRWPAMLRRIPLTMAVIAPLIMAAALLPTAVAAWRTPIDGDMERAYSFIASLPNDTLVAAHPDLADYIPLRTRHSVLASSEGSIAFMRGYYERVVPRIDASLRAAYATSWDELQAALAPYDVDVMLTAPSVWEKSTYYAPFDALARALIERGRREGFVMQSPPPDRVLFRSGDVYVVRVGAGLGSSG
jgi:hypothetical protein